MSDYHILTQDVLKRSVSVVFHVPVPAVGTNAANISWRSAVVLEQGGADNIVSVLPGIDAAEVVQMKAGELIEKPDTVRFSGVGLTPAQRKMAIDAAFTGLASSLIAEKQITLEWIGYNGDVA